MTEKILVIQTAFLGDLILSTALLKKIKQKHGDAELTVIVNRGTESILEKNPYIHRVIPVDKKTTFKNPIRFVKFLSELRNERFSICYCPHFSHRSSLISFFSGAITRIGYRESGFSFLHTKTVPRPIRGMHELDKLNALVMDNTPVKPEIYLDLNSMASIERILSGIGPYIVIAPSSIWETKRMPIEKFEELIGKILKSSDFRPVIVGSKADVYLGGYLSDKFPGKILDLTGKTTLGELSYVISRARAIVSNDSSPIHIASAFNTPTLAIFGATIPDFGYTPVADLNYISEVQLECRPCGIHGGRFCPKKHFRCMLDQDIDRMFEKLIYLTGEY